MAGAPVREVVTRRSPPHLRPYVEGITDYRLAGFAPGIHRGLPGRNLTWIIDLGGGVDIAAMPDRREEPQRIGAFVSGLCDAPALIRHDGSQRGLSLALTPAGARALFGCPAAELAGRVVDFDELGGRRAAELVERLHETRDAPRRLALAEAFVARAAVASAPAWDAVDHAWRRVVDSGGMLAVGELAGELGYSRRQLGERFRREIGLSPKTAARIVRFERACARIGRPDREGLAAIAAGCGYADQAHLNREFRDLAGCTPSQWIAEDLPIVQDGRRQPAPG